ncbi:MAG: sigma-70 family RNA polymerase sigma factor, partial [Chloroflexota bacterium]|nr:sigma-70 family RNA polymerase sigma factor [Chloroflexota bacterium]
MANDDERTDELVDRAREGDQAALGALYDRLAERLYRFAFFRLGNRADAEDLTQRTFLKMIEALPRYQRRGIPFEAWFFRIARNGLVDLLRARRSHEPLEALHAARSSEVGPEAAAERASEFASVERAMTQLTDEQRTVIAYRFMAGLSPREVGLVMGKREGTVRGLQFRALVSLRRTLREAD